VFVIVRQMQVRNQPLSSLLTIQRSKFVGAFMRHRFHAAHRFWTLPSGRTCWITLKCCTTHPSISESNTTWGGLPLEGLQKRDEILLVLLREMKAKTRVIEVDGIAQCSGRAVMEIRCTRSKTSQYRPLDLAYVIEIAIH
jgi:hypothetical protein